MSNAKLLAVTVERFKSFETRTRVELAPLTIILGRNNSGKSSLIQSLLLLKQTLSDARPDVMFKHEGVVEAFNLRELTYGWPAQADAVLGPSIVVEWECDVAARATLDQPRPPDLANLATLSGVPWLAQPPDRRTLRTTMCIDSVEVRGTTKVASIRLESIDAEQTTTLVVTVDDSESTCTWNGQPASKVVVEFDHFIPYLRLDRGELGGRDRQRAWHTAYLVLFAQPLQDLKRILTDLQYLGSSREPPPSLYRVKAAPNELGVSGELAANLLHRRERDVVHFLPLPDLLADVPAVSNTVRALPLVEAVNDVLAALSVRASVRVQEVQEVGFRVMFGEASIVHVGRGLGYLLPLVELGLFADPMRFTGAVEDLSLSDYAERCGAFTQVVLEEPEAHLHPKVASRLAHWLVSLAMSNRRVIVETHSDHLVRRLRGLVARAGRGSALETWLLANVVVLSVEQDEFGRSSATSSRLTAEGGVSEVWPADFMDESTEEESAIYYAKLDKTKDDSVAPTGVVMVDGPEPEVDEVP